MLQPLEPLRRDAGDVPEEIQCENAIKTGETGESLVGEGPVDQEMGGIVIVFSGCSMASMPRLEHWKLVQHRQSRIRHEAARIEAAQSRLSAQRIDSTVARRRSHEVDDFKLVAKLQVRHAGIGDAALPCHVERSKIGQMAKYFQATVVEMSARILTEFNVLQLRHPCQSLHALIAELTRSAQA